MSTGFPYDPNAHQNQVKRGLEMNFWKKERINYHREYIEEILVNPPEDIDWQLVLEDHLIQTTQFQHERFMHLIVTMTFAISSMVVACFTVYLQSLVLTALLLMLLVLLIPYILYYFMLENNTQAMYPLCDGIWAKLVKQRKAQGLPQGTPALSTQILTQINHTVGD